MANVTQLIPNYLGGVSRKADFDKDPGQVRDAVNAYPDETYGMLKRPGTKLLSELPIPDGTNTDWDDWSFFPLIREGRPRYLVAIQSGNMIIWNMDDYTLATITFENNAIGYLSHLSASGIDRKDMFRMASDDRRSIIVNRSKTIDAIAVGAEGTGGTGSDSNDQYRYSGTLGYIWANTDSGKYRNANNIGELPDSSAKAIEVINRGDGSQGIAVREGWHILSTTHGDINKAQGLTVKCYIDSNGKIATGTHISIVSAGFGYYENQSVSLAGINASQITITTGLQVGHTYRVKQTSASDDDYYMMPFSSTTNDRGPFYWVETSAPDSAYGLNNYQLPYTLVEDSTNNFTLKLTDYSNRWVGDNVNNPDPSFVGHRIENVFFSNNRLGFLSQDNVIMSRPINYGPPESTDQDLAPDDNPWVRRNYTEVDFYHQSALQQVDDDPIDLNAASNDTSVFHKAISTPQGLVLFSDGQQSLMFSDEGILTPANANIRGISAYDVAPDIDPVMQGSVFYFANKTDKYCRLYGMQTQGLEAPPVFQDLSKEVSDWLPNDITDLVSSSTTNQIILFNRVSNYLYTLTMSEDTAAWTRWELPSKPIKVIFDHTGIYTLMQIGTKLYLTLSEMFLYPNSELSTLPIDEISPHLDYFGEPSAVSSTAITPPSGFPYIAGLQPCYLVPSTGEVGNLTTSDGGVTYSPGTDLSAEDLVIGYRYNFELELPTLFYQQGEGRPDYTAYFTVSRLKFALSFPGNIKFQSKALGSSSWVDMYSQTEADYYSANSAVTDDARIVTVPIHQRNNHFQFKITSDTPFPLSVDSCMWEGIYSPRYYRRS